MKSILASASCCIVERYLQIVLPQEPPEDTAGFLAPALFEGQLVGLKTSRDCGAGFDRLLIEAGLLRALGEASAGADGNEDLPVTAMLRRHKPFERLNSHRDHLLVLATAARQDKRLRQPSIRVGEALLEPMPGFRVTALVNIKQPIGERVARALHCPVTGEPVEIGLQTENTECPCARAREAQNGRHGGLKQSSCRSPQSGVLRLTQRRAQGPQRAAVAVFRANVFQPFAIVAQKV